MVVSPGNMDVRVGLLFLFVLLGICWACDGRYLLTSDPSSETTVVSDFSVPAVQIECQNREEEVEDLDQVLCTLCERFTTEALDYLADNTTQTDIIDLLHNTCSQMWNMKQKCMAMVDYYAPLFFSEVSMIKPGNFCQDVNLCTTTFTSPPLFQGSCEFCRHAVAEVVVKLKDPDRQVLIMELLLKGCDAVVEGYVNKCKNMVSEYAPLVLTNAELYLETTDICNTLHACHVPTISTHQD
ncbi:uncharacterized protein LOC100255017 isoform X1 [Vitis vinifera]|uniref:uncharacterized protein LOC100255017 isoform X1 n=1 Tax=Vitis vinifera TaxID=29760 RepID=UPI00053F9C07|nr:uncharacterized protein LOC100255017 isoform X1 [Vitis vinifera]|eukprot:XP_002266541.2 PREDICTED: prosaposin isoform X1 [Vitis vinifera]